MGSPPGHDRDEAGAVKGAKALEPPVDADVSDQVYTGASDDDAQWIGRSLAGRFTVISRLGSGSMGTVFRATQEAMARQVAIKILRPERALDDTSKARFLREARTTSLLTSPHTVTVFDFGESESGELYLAMELLEGESVGERLTRQGRLSASEAVDATRQALRSLGEAHSKGIVHRDLKPDNLFFAKVHGHEDTSELLKVLDFGIAKMLRGDSRAINAVETQAGTVFGTPRYMSPEQAQGKQLDARSDLYSLGVILYHMLTGAPPFTDDDAIMVMARHIKSEPVPVRQACPDADVPDAIEAVVQRALSKNPDDRPSSAEEFSAELSRALGDPRTSPRPPAVAARHSSPPRPGDAAPRAWPWALAALLITTLAGTAFWFATPSVRHQREAASRAAEEATPRSESAAAPTSSQPAASTSPDPAEPRPSAEPSALAAEDDEPADSRAGSRTPARVKGRPAAASGGANTGAAAPSGSSGRSYGVFEN